MSFDDGSGIVPGISLPSLDEQADVAEKHHLETLLFCPDAWALRHGFVNQDTGETTRARCNRWDCLYCGPRKVDQWRQLVKVAEPTLFLTLSKSGKAVEEAARAPSKYPFPRSSSQRCYLVTGSWVHPKVVQENLGHSQIGITMDIYSHVLPIIHQEAMGKLNEAFTHGDEEEETNNDDTASGGWC